MRNRGKKNKKGGRIKDRGKRQKTREVCRESKY